VKPVPWVRRTTRKRKRALWIVNTDHETKRRKKVESFSERSANGFCAGCTNPYKLMTCTQCYASWHFDCFKKRLIGDDRASTPIATKEVQKLKAEKDDEVDGISSDSSLSDDDADECNDKENVSIISNHKLPSAETEAELEPAPEPKITSTIDTAESSAICSWDDHLKRLSKAQSNSISSAAKNRQPIRLPPLPKTKDDAQGMREWIDTVAPMIAAQTALYNDESKKQIMALFVCADCVYQSHQCLICKTDRAEPVIRCSTPFCGRHYHTSCLREDAQYAQHTTFRQNGNVICPAHHCWACFDVPRTGRTTQQARKDCWFCPRSFHRQCVPPAAELLAVQIIDTDAELQRYPTFRYDLITCRGDHTDAAHPKPCDLQFGRDDAAAGIFKWRLWDDSKAVFYRLDDDPFSIDLQMKRDYETRQSKGKSSKSKGAKEWQKGFKYITKSWHSKSYKKPRAAPDYGACGCREGCARDWSCQNYGMSLECNDEICGAADPSLCANRQWATAQWSGNVRVQQTQSTGFGVFARRKLAAQQLIIEYVGEVISKEESLRRLRQQNADHATNFYFFQVDGRTVIDGTHCGNESRFLNHSCAPNCHTTMWIVDGEERLGIFASCDIRKGEQLTYDYQYEVPDCSDPSNLAKCMCGAKHCRFYLGFNRKMADAHRAMLKEKGEWSSSSSGAETDEEEQRRKDKKRKKRKKRKRNKKKKKKESETEASEGK